ncbi:MAG: DUF5926 family protein [Cellulomonadaceae bacterium]|jgi:hypothetical protein|nr:DUF5926 family protein [Cellulomonadaceae bacterium]
MAKKTGTALVLRPFEGLPNEPDWVAMRELIPSATGTARTVAKYGQKDVMVCTILPGGFAAMNRPDGTVLLALQGQPSTADLSRDLAGTLLKVLDSEPGTAVRSEAIFDEAAPRLQDVLDLSVPLNISVNADYEYWVDATATRDADMEASLQEAAEYAVPSQAVEGVDHAYWCQMTKPFVRWVRAEDEDVVVDAIARLHARRQSALVLDGGKEARFLGMFRAAGLVVPVWELPDGTTAEDVSAPMVAMGTALDEAMGSTDALNALERRAREGIRSRQVTLR